MTGFIAKSRKGGFFPAGAINASVVKNILCIEDGRETAASFKEGCFACIS
jgi:hypothetical protein